MPEYEELLQFSIDIARRAGELVLPSFRSVVTPERKTDGTYVTAADRAAETFLREQIARAYPDDEIVGEEYGVATGTSGRRWIVDPIDGTCSFVHGVPLFGVLVGVESQAETVVGVAHFPALGQTIAAARGGGCFLDGKRVRTSATALLDEATIVTNEPLAAPALIERARIVRGWGDCYGYMLVATGRADIALDPEMNVWDCAALQPIVEEAGGSFTDWRGTRTIRGGNAVATNGPLLREAIRSLRQRPG